MQRKFNKAIVAVALVVCFCVVFNSVSAFASVTPDLLDVENIEIIERHGIIEGSSYQLEAEILPENTLKSAVKWSSSKPSVISCTDDGIITGISAGGYANITCKAKFGSENDKIRVYCVESIGEPVKSGFNNIITPIFAAPDSLTVVAWYFDWFSVFRDFVVAIFPVIKMLNIPTTVADANELMFFASKCTVLGKYDSYAYITFDNGNGERDGFVKYSRLSNAPNDFLELSSKTINVWGDGVAYSDKKLITDYNGKGQMVWKVSDENIIDFDDKTGQITGLKPGRVIITATVDGMKETCTVHSLYKWPQSWKTKTNCDTKLYLVEGTEYKASRSMQQGTVFEVFGDNGTSDGWAYGKATINGTACWGYVPIDKVSTKNTISFYNNLNWGYPLKNEEYNYLYSPFAPRSSQGDEHRGMDINEKSDQADIEGQPLVAAFDGVVKEAKYNSSAGNYVCITSKHDTDTVTGEKIIAIYMHMQYLPLVSKGDVVEKGKTILGYAGNTGGSTGSHLHFEANNKNAVVDDEIRKSYTYTINPIYFYMDRKFAFNNGCSAAENGYGFYWYNHSK